MTTDLETLTERSGAKGVENWWKGFVSNYRKRKREKKGQPGKEQLEINCNKDEAIFGKWKIYWLEIG